KSSDRRQALGIALELERVERQARAGVLTTTQLKKILNDVAEKVTGDSILAPAVEVYLKEWLAGVKVRNTGATVERYKNTVRLFLVSLGPKAQKPITSVTAKDAEDFLNSRLKAGA